MTLNKERIKESADFVLSRLLVVFFFALLIVYASREIADLDLWLHLKTGEVIVRARSVPTNDMFSFTLQGKPWVNHEWLFQVIAYLFYSCASFDGLIFMQNLVLIATFGLLFLSGAREKNHIFVFVVLYLTLLSSAYRFTIRPDIFSLFFLTLFLFVLKAFREKRSWLIWLLPFVQVLWVNMHGFAFTGPLLVLFYLAGEILKRTAKLPYEWNGSGRLDNGQMKQLLLVFLLLTAAFLLNPSGPKGAAYPLSVLGQISGKGRVIFQYIQELARPVTLSSVFQADYFVFYKAFILLSFFSFRVNQRHLNVTHLLLWLLFLVFSLLAIRNVAYFALVAAFMTFDNVTSASARKKEPPLKIKSPGIRAFAAYAAMAFLFYYPARGALKYFETSTYSFDTYELKPVLWGISQGRFPKKAVDFLLREKFPARLFNDFNAGSYLIGRAYPQRQVFIDGRTELYGPDFFLDYVAAGEGKKDVLERVLAAYDIQGFFLTNAPGDLHAGLLKFLFLDPRWKVVYFDESAVIFLKDTKENAGLIKKFAIDLQKWSPPEPDLLKIGIAYRYPLPFLNRARLLNLLGCSAAAAREARAALAIQPNSAEALKVLAVYHLERKEYAAAFAYTRNALIYSSGDLFMRTRLALLYHFLNEQEKALKVIDAVIRKKPKYAEGYYVKALILEDTDPKTAEELLRKAAKLQAKDPKYHVLLGDLQAREGDLQGAKKAWQAAFEYDSANRELKKKLGL